MNEIRNMEYYYLTSFLSTLVLFVIIQYIEYNRSKNEPEYEYSLFTLNNILLFVIIFIVITIALHYLSPIISKIDFTSINMNMKGGGSTTATTIEEIKEIDPKILSKINDNFDVGFEPFCSDIE
jgi:hypothetical protein